MVTSTLSSSHSHTGSEETQVGGVVGLGPQEQGELLAASMFVCLCD